MDFKPAFVAMAAFLLGVTALAPESTAKPEVEIESIVRVWRDGSRLMSQAIGEEKATELLPSGADVFFVDGDYGDYIFGRDGDGKVDRLIFRLSGSKDIEFRRLK